jgi:hypothetical protein
VLENALSLFVFSPGSDEQKFLEACLAYAAGKPNMSDAEFDSLKRKLKVMNRIMALCIL